MLSRRTLELRPGPRGLPQTLIASQALRDLRQVVANGIEDFEQAIDLHMTPEPFYLSPDHSASSATCRKSTTSPSTCSCTPS